MPIGVQPDYVLFATTDVNLAGYKDFAPIEQRLLNALRQIPGVESAALSNTTPLSPEGNSTSIYPPGTTFFSPASRKFNAPDFSVGPGYFHTAGTRLLSGRDFTAHDDAKAPAVAIVNQTFAKQLFGTVNAVGKSTPSLRENSQVIGVVEDGNTAASPRTPRPLSLFHRAITRQRHHLARPLAPPRVRNRARHPPRHHRSIHRCRLSVAPWRESLAFVTSPPAPRPSRSESSARSP